MSLAPIHATINALRSTLCELEHMPDSDELALLKNFLLVHIAGLESRSDAPPDAVLPNAATPRDPEVRPNWLNT